MGIQSEATSNDVSVDFFRNLEIKRTQALVNCDVELVESLHANDYELISPPGRTMSLDDYLDHIRVKPFYAAWEYGDMRVRHSNSIAVVRYQARITFPSGDIYDLWHTDVYECFEGIWKAVWSQATQVS